MNQISRLMRSMSVTWAKHLQFLRHDLGSHRAPEVPAATASGAGSLTAALGERGSRRDGKSVRISLAEVICGRIVLCPFVMCCLLVRATMRRFTLMFIAQKESSRHGPVIAGA